VYRNALFIGVLSVGKKDSLTGIMSRKKRPFSTINGKSKRFIERNYKKI
jgi:hypothetical protein